MRRAVRFVVLTKEMAAMGSRHGTQSTGSCDPEPGAGAAAHAG